MYKVWKLYVHRLLLPKAKNSNSYSFSWNARKVIFYFVKVIIFLQHLRKLNLAEKKMLVFYFSFRAWLKVHRFAGKFLPVLTLVLNFAYFHEYNLPHFPSHFLNILVSLLRIGSSINGCRKIIHSLFAGLIRAFTSFHFASCCIIYEWKSNAYKIIKEMEIFSPPPTFKGAFETRVLFIKLIFYLLFQNFTQLEPTVNMLCIKN